MQRALYPDLFTPSAAGPVADPVAVMESVTSAYPGDRVSGVDAPTTVRPTYLAYSTSGNRFRTLLLDPVTTTLLGELDDRSVIRDLQDLHFDLLGGRTGRLVNGIGALCLVAMCLTGAVIWWPGRTNWRRSLKVDFTRQWKRVNWDLHSAVGFWSVAFILMWAVTGAYFAFPSGFRSVVNRISPITVTRAPQSSPRVGQSPAPTWREMVDQAQRHAPGQHVARAVLPFDDKAAFLVMFSSVRPAPPGADLTSVYLDQYHGSAARRGRAIGTHRWRRDPGVGGAAARRQLRRQRCACGVARARPGAAAALRDRLHHVVDAGGATALAARLNARQRSRIRALNSAGRSCRRCIPFDRSR